MYVITYIGVMRYLTIRNKDKEFTQRSSIYYKCGNTKVSDTFENYLLNGATNYRHCSQLPLQRKPFGNL